MADGYHVVIDEVRRSAVAAREAADIVSDIEIANAVLPVGQALPGSRAALSAGRLASSWESRTTNWSVDTQTYADRLVAAADEYDNNEQGTASAFGLIYGSQLWLPQG